MVRERVETWKRARQTTRTLREVTVVGRVGEMITEK